MLRAKAGREHFGKYILLLVTVRVSARGGRTQCWKWIFLSGDVTFKLEQNFPKTLQPDEAKVALQFSHPTGKASCLVSISFLLFKLYPSSCPLCLCFQNLQFSKYHNINQSHMPEFTIWNSFKTETLTLKTDFTKSAQRYRYVKTLRRYNYRTIASPGKVLIYIKRIRNCRRTTEFLNHLSRTKHSISVHLTTLKDLERHTRTKEARHDPLISLPVRLIFKTNNFMWFIVMLL